MHASWTKRSARFRASRFRRSRAIAPTSITSTVSTVRSGTNWWSPSFSPDTGLFYVNAHHHFMVSYLTLDDQDENKASDHQGGANSNLWSQSMLLAQMLLAAAFLVFLMYPAVHLLLQA